MTETSVATAEILGATYAGLVDALAGIDDQQAWLPTGCAGWAVRDVAYHLLTDAQRGLVGLCTPVEDEPDTDAVSYWRGAEGGRTPRGSGQASLRMTRVASASAFATTGELLERFAETTTAVGHAARSASPYRAVRSRGRVLLVEDLLRTLIVEAAVHHLDLVVVLDRPGPAPAALRLVRWTLDGLLGEPMPLPVDDATYARLGAGRHSLSVEQRHALGARAHRFPLLG